MSSSGPSHALRPVSLGLLLALATACAGPPAGPGEAGEEGPRWLAGDHHIHSRYSVGWDTRTDPPTPIVAGDAIYQAYMEPSVPGICSAPALFTAINKDTAELHHEQVAFDADLAQRMSDRAVRILQATDAGELLPRIAASRDFFECRFCAHAERCWGLAA